MGEEANIIKYLTEHDIFPFSVFFTYVLNDKNGTLSITFYCRSNLQEFLILTGYDKLCDKSGYKVLYDTNTVIIDGGNILLWE